MLDTLAKHTKKLLVSLQGADYVKCTGINLYCANKDCKYPCTSSVECSSLGTFFDIIFQLLCKL
jgi:hypothetical protein